MNAKKQHQCKCTRPSKIQSTFCKHTLSWSHFLRATIAYVSWSVSPCRFSFLLLQTWHFFDPPAPALTDAKDWIDWTKGPQRGRYVLDPRSYIQLWIYSHPGSFSGWSCVTDPLRSIQSNYVCFFVFEMLLDWTRQNFEAKVYSYFTNQRFEYFKIDFKLKNNVHIPAISLGLGHLYVQTLTT